MNENDNFFLKQMKGVSPLKKNHKVEKKTISANKIKVFKKNYIKEDDEIISNKIKENIKNTEFNLERVGLKKNIKKGFLELIKK